ncbi:RecQ mediated genome instability protein 1, N-terminal, partial [Dillenia turbinata]
MEGSSSSSEALLETLKKRGWSFEDTEQLYMTIPLTLTLILPLLSSIQLNPTSPTKSYNLSALNPCLILLFSANLLMFWVPKSFRVVYVFWVLVVIVNYVSSVRDISRSSIETESKASKRLLGLGLTDGHSDVIAIEYSYIPSLSDGIVPGTKICLENKVMVCSGIVCLNPKVITVLRGAVKSLYEEWQLNQKYSGLSRSSIRWSQEGERSGPRPFEKLQIGAPSHFSGSATKNLVKTGESSSREQIGDRQIDSSTDGKEDNGKTVSDIERTEGKLSCCEARTLQVAEADQADLQKLLQKMSKPNQQEWQHIGLRHRGKRNQEKREFLTLDEWGRRNAGGSLARGKIPDLSQDEELAWQLQHELDLQDHFTRNPREVDAKNLKMSMFNCGRDDGRTGSMSRGR